MEYRRNTMGNVAVLCTPDNLVQMTKSFEGFRKKPYKCSAGKLTIGYGRNLTDVGISQSEAEMLFNHDMLSAELDAIAWLKKNNINYKDLSQNRFYVVTDMMFNLGWDRCQGFVKFISALKKGLYDDAANEMIDSKWATQVGNRAIVLSGMMRNG